MAYKIKVKRGRHEKKFKERTFDGFASKGFEFHKVSTKKKAVIFKRKE